MQNVDVPPLLWAVRREIDLVLQQKVQGQRAEKQWISTLEDVRRSDLHARPACHGFALASNLKSVHSKVCGVSGRGSRWRGRHLLLAKQPRQPTAT